MLRKIRKQSEVLDHLQQSVGMSGSGEMVHSLSCKHEFMFQSVFLCFQSVAVEGYETGEHAPGLKLKGTGAYKAAHHIIKVRLDRRGPSKSTFKSFFYLDKIISPQGPFSVWSFWLDHTMFLSRHDDLGVCWVLNVILAGVSGFCYSELF